MASIWNGMATLSPRTTAASNWRHSLSIPPQSHRNLFIYAGARQIVITRFKTEGLVIALQGRLVILESQQSIASVAVSFGIIRIEQDGLVEALQGRLAALKTLQSIAAVVVGFRKIGTEQDGLVEALQGRFVLLQSQQCDASIVVGLRLCPA